MTSTRALVLPSPDTFARFFPSRPESSQLRSVVVANGLFNYSKRLARLQFNLCVRFFYLYTSSFLSPVFLAYLARVRPSHRALPLPFLFHVIREFYLRKGNLNKYAEVGICPNFPSVSLYRREIK